MLPLALALASLVGVALGLLGGGGSILTLPILSFVLGQEAHAAVAGSLFVVGMTSLVGVVPHARAGRVRWRIGLVFGAAAMLGAFLAGRAAHAIPPAVLLVLFAAMMIVTAIAMLRGRRAPSAPRDAAGPALSVPKALLEGLVVGAITGLVGAGGGFLVVPALVLFGGLPMASAVGTSLLVIAMKSFAGFAGHVGSLSALGLALDWPALLALSGIAIGGSFIGARLAGKIPEATLRKAFGAFVVAMGAFILFQEVPKLLPPDLATDLAAGLSPLAVAAIGGALVGLAATLLLWSHGRVAGISGMWSALVTGGADRGLRLAFVGGLALSGLLALAVAPELLPASVPAPLAVTALAGLLVGFGTRLGNGCTSGHGVAGCARLSPRSLVATASFMIAGAATVALVRHALGGL